MGGFFPSDGFIDLGLFEHRPKEKQRQTKDRGACLFDLKTGLEALERRKPLSSERPGLARFFSLPFLPSTARGLTSYLPARDASAAWQPSTLQATSLRLRFRNPWFFLGGDVQALPAVPRRRRPDSGSLSLPLSRPVFCQAPVVWASNMDRQKEIFELGCVAETKQRRVGKKLREGESSLYDNHRLHDSDRRARGEPGLDVMQRAEYVTPPLRCPTDNRESGMPSTNGQHIESQKTSIPISCNRCQEPSLATTLASQHTAGSSLRPH